MGAGKIEGKKVRRLKAGRRGGTKAGRPEGDKAGIIVIEGEKVRRLGG